MQSVNVEKLTKICGGNKGKKYLLDNISFEIEAGEFVVIKGNSEIEKLSLFYMLAGLESPSNGNIKVDNINIQSLSKERMTVFRRRKVNLINKTNNLIPTLTVEKNVALPVVLDKRGVKVEKLNNLIEEFDLKDKKNKYPENLSEEEQKRVVIVRSIFINSIIMLVDNTESEMTKEDLSKFSNYLKIANKKYHRTILIITESNEIIKNANRIIEIIDGKIKNNEKVRN